MAQYESDTNSMSSLPTNSHAGMVMGHRSAVIFSLATALAAGDLLVLGKFPAGYILDGVMADSDGVAGLKADLQLMDSLTTPTKTIKVAALDFIEKGSTTSPLTYDAVRFKGSERPMYLVAKVTAAGSAGIGAELGVTTRYRYRQPTY